MKDVSINEPLEGDVLRYDGDDWENVAPDSEPTDDSGNLVTSGGVYDALNDIWEANGRLGSKNLLPNNAISSGIFTVNDDKSITINGTNTGSSNMDLILYEGILPNFKTNDIFSGGFGGSDSVVGISLIYRDANNTYISQQNCFDDEVRLSIPSNARRCKIVIYVLPDKTVDTTFYPMIRVADDTDPTYQPYAMTNRELTEKVQGIIDVATNAADFAAFKTAIGLL